MASIIIRGIDEAVMVQLAERAMAHGRSMEAEAREILTRAVQRPHIGMALLTAGQDIGGIGDLAIPERDDTARAIDLE